jgi:ABC-type bacteriocin/lantibiotic exporter with double-glycine peptidase domain
VQRLTLVQEILWNIKTLKTFSLLDNFEEKVKEKREDELKV